MKINSIKNVLDMGSGSGIIALFFLLVKKYIPKFNPTIYASDIIEEAINTAKKNEKLNGFKDQIKFIHSDLFNSFPENLKNTFDIIIFNPPYLPSLNSKNKLQKNKNNNLNWNGGQYGYEVILRFLQNVKDYLILNGKGFIYFITSSISFHNKIYDIIEKGGFIHRIIDKKHIFFEDIIFNRLELT